NFAPEMVILVVPVFFNCTVWETVVPRGTLPKFTVSGVMVNAPFTPVPVRIKFTRLLVALLPNATCPLIVPNVMGVKFTVMVKWAPGSSVRGKLRPPSVYIFATRLPVLMETLAVPVLLMVTAMLFVVPTCTLPKFAADGLKERVPDACALLGIMAARQIKNAPGSRLPYRCRHISPLSGYLEKNFRRRSLHCLRSKEKSKRVARGLYSRFIYQKYEMRTVRATAQRRKICSGP